MRFIKKYAYIILCTIILLCIAFYGITKSNPALPCFMIQSSNESGTKELSVFSGSNENYYVFLPSYADMELVTITLPTADRFTLDDINLSEGMHCGVFELENPYIFKINGKQAGTLWFYRSENIATMYIDTNTGSMNYIHSNKNAEENASVTLYTADGQINYSASKNTIKGRGNATWEREKRPYSLILSDDADLLGMGAAQNWILLANAYDETNLNNKLVFDLAAQVGLPWTCDYRYVDVYLNGEYNGLYLLTEKVEIHESRLNIGADASSFLCKIDLAERWDSLRNPFLSNAGRTIEIVNPNAPTTATTNTITQLVNQMEQVLLSGTDLSKTTIVDLDSWVYRYLIDEISGNIDSDLASSYFYYDNGTFYAGPVWDYDMAFGNNLRNQSAQSFIAKNLQKSDIFLSPYYSTLYTNQSFYLRMQEIYETEFRPILQQIIDEEIDISAAHIRKAAQMNSLRWRAMFDKLQNRQPNAVHSVAELQDYLVNRVQFLDSAWLENVNYCTVQFESVPGDKYRNISVAQGSCLDISNSDLASTVWIDAATGEPFDFRQPVTRDMILTPQSAKMPMGTADYVTFLSIGLLILSLIILVIVDTIQRRKERSCANERH